MPGLTRSRLGWTRPEDWERTEQKPSRSWAGQEWPDGIFRLPVVAVPSDLLVAVPAAPSDLPVALWGLPVTSPPRGVPTAALAAAQVTSEDQEVPEHKPVELRCAAFRSSSGSARIEWKFQRGSSLALIYYGGELTEPYRDRVQFSPTSIRFGSVTREDSGKYICEVVGDGSHIAKSEVNLIVQVPPGKPLAQGVPGLASPGAPLPVSLSHVSTPPTFRWYKDGTELPQDPKSSPAFRNSSYSLDPRTGELVFEPVGGWDTGDYHCEASNNVGSPQKSDVFRMEASEVNVGGIVAAVVLLLLVLGLAAFGVWFAHRRGYFSKKTDAGGKKVIYSQPSQRSEGEFKQTSSFLV
ncbi:junctional adhesion molecule A [Geospiza fortis]|uniref:Junctional adhesion molecule A n=1 Tax=Geospiza fortis TaxID=48883 RepID=A0A8N5I554_GEOFO|nr:junctional adhesion molecule A [Geospiza fortis]